MPSRITAKISDGISIKPANIASEFTMDKIRTRVWVLVVEDRRPNH